MKEIERRVKKPVSTIHCSNPISLIGRKLFNIFLWKALKDDEKLYQEDYEVGFDLLLRYTNTHRKNKNYIKDFLLKTQELQTTIIQWSIPDEKIYGSSQMLGSIQVDEKQNKVIYTFPLLLRQLIRDNQLFEMIRLSITKLFKSKYSLSLYENCIRYKNVGSTGYRHIEEWKKLLGATANKYKETYKFNHYVLKPAMEEINSISDIKIYQQNKRTNRKISHIRFHIEKKDGLENVVELKDLRHNEMLRNLDLSIQKQKSLFDEEMFSSQADKAREIRDKVKNK